ncbi:MAG: hypothetical protein LBU44_03360 [Mediterranea sp.]|jgi:tetratricopeptide (TPR) repeat protein|nr:hypothetical protein [Mediterranea sp.]
MSYLVLHIDMEFIVGAVCTDNGISYPITNGKEDLLWLYFFNNPHQNSISFGKDNKTHFNNSEVNYYGRFFEKIEKEQDKFLLRGIEHPVINLLKESGLIDIVKNAYQQKTLDNTEVIPTLLAFSSSISDNAKQKMVDYLKKQGFQIDSYTIPLAELACYHTINQKKLNLVNGSIAVFLEATNAMLSLMKLSLSDNYFLKDSKTISHRGKGLDPRKRALARFVVNEVNKTTGVLSNDDEKEEEIERLEAAASDWLKRLDAQTRKNLPLRIPSVSFAKAPSMPREVIVRKDDLDSDTGQYIQDLKDIYDAFKSDHVKGDISMVFLLGNCFQSERVRSSFEQIIGRERIHFYTNNDIYNILAIYPKIDVNRYASEEARIKERAKAEEQKQAEQRALEDKQRKEAEEAANRQAEAQREEQNRKEAQKLFNRAVELEKDGKLEDARVNVKNAISLDRMSREYKLFLSDLNERIDNLNAKNDLYKSYLNKGDKLLVEGELGKSLEEYEAAQNVFDNAEIIKKIIEVKRLIKNKEQQKLIQQQEKEKKEAEIRELLNKGEGLLLQKQLTEAETIFNRVLAIDKNNGAAKVKLEEIKRRKSVPPPPPVGGNKANNQPKAGVSTPPPIPVKPDVKPQGNTGASKNTVAPPPPAVPVPKQTNGRSVPPPPPPPRKK